MTRICVVLLVLGAITSANAQGDFLNPGQKGYKVTAGYVKEKTGFKGLYSEVGISVTRVLDLSLGYEKLTSSGSGETKAWKLRPTATVNLIKKEENRNTLGTSLSAGFIYEQQSRPDWRSSGDKMTAKSVMGEVRFFYNKVRDDSNIIQYALFFRPEVGKSNRRDPFRDHNNTLLGSTITAYIRSGGGSAFIRTGMALSSECGTMWILAGFVGNTN